MDSSSTVPFRHVANEAQAVLSWHDEDIRSDVSLCPATPATLLLSLDVSQGTAAIRFRIPFTVSSSHANLFAFIDPRNVRQLTTNLEPSTIPEFVWQSPIAIGPAQRIAMLEFHLHNPPTVVGPASATRLRPRHRADGDLLACLKSMVSAHSLVVFVDRDSLRTELLSSFCTQVSDAGLLPSTTYYALECLYQGSGGKDVGDLLSTFKFSSSRDPEAGAQAPGEADDLAVPVDVEPPAYDEIQREPPRLSRALPSASSRGKRRASRENLAASSPKKPAVVNPASFSSEIEQLRAVVDQLRHQILNHPVAPGSPTEDGSVLDRFDAIERRLSALEEQSAENRLVTARTVDEANSTEKRLAAVEAELANRPVEMGRFREGLIDALLPRVLETFQPYVEQRLDYCTHDWIAEKVEQEVEDQYSEAQTALETQRDDLDMYIREKMASVVQDDLADVVAEQLSDVIDDRLENIVLEVLETSSFTMHTSRRSG